jgi:hypothetical protein
MSLRYGRHSARGIQQTGDEDTPLPADGETTVPADTDNADAVTDPQDTTDPQSVFTPRPTFTPTTAVPVTGTVPGPAPAADDAAYDSDDMVNGGDDTVYDSDDTVNDDDDAVPGDSVYSETIVAGTVVDEPAVSAAATEPGTGYEPAAEADDGSFAGADPDTDPVTADAYDTPVAQPVPSAADLDEPALVQSVPVESVPVESVPAQSTPVQSVPAAAPAAALDTPLLSNTTGLRERWQAVQAEFVDDPREAVGDAAALLEQTTQALVDALQQRQRDLRSGWDSGDANGTGTATADGTTDTERLRLTLQRYRGLFNQLTQV